MPIKSYLAFPQPGKLAELANALKRTSGCEVTPAANQALLLLVTDTANAEEEKALERRLQAIESLLALTLVAGFQDPEEESVVLSLES